MHVRNKLYCVEHVQPVDVRSIVDGVGIGACGCRVNCTAIRCSDCQSMIPIEDWKSTLKTIGFCKNCVDIYGRMMGGSP